MLADEVLEKAILPITDVSTIIHVANPPLQMAVYLVFVPYPVSFALEHLQIFARVPGARVRLNVIDNMLCPIRGLGECFDLVTYLTL